MSQVDLIEAQRAESAAQTKLASEQAELKKWQGEVNGIRAVYSATEGNLGRLGEILGKDDPLAIAQDQKINTELVKLRASESKAIGAVNTMRNRVNTAQDQYNVAKAKVENILEQMRNPAPPAYQPPPQVVPTYQPLSVAQTLLPRIQPQEAKGATTSVTPLDQGLISAIHHNSPVCLVG